jgi:hypothetical protein
VLVALPASAAASEEVEARTVFTFADEQIDESSGLVARDGVMFTVNDSGDGPVLYRVHPRSGETVGETTYSSQDVRDVEALAPGRGGAVWVGDIGDNNAERPYVEVYRVLPGASAPAERFRLVYPDGPHDAETLLVHPRSGRLHVVSKEIMGGAVYAAPATLEPGSINRMTEIGRVPGLLTDGTFLPDGRHVLLRGYGSAAVYTFPALREVASVQLPPQEQGEAVAVDEDGRVFISTEGSNTEVLEVLLPSSMRVGFDSVRPRDAGVGKPGDAATSSERATPSDAATPAGAQEPDDPARPHGLRGADGVLGWIGAAVLVGAFALRWFLRFSRRRSRRTR